MWWEIMAQPPFRILLYKLCASYPVGDIATISLVGSVLLQFEPHLYFVFIT
jgi:hypothetical protein